MCRDKITKDKTLGTMEIYRRCLDIYTLFHTGGRELRKEGREGGK